MKFIALHKHSRSATLGVATAATAAKRSEILRDAAHSERSVRLVSLGLPQFEPELRAHQDHGFERLGNLGCYIVETDDPQQEQAAREVLEHDYLILPDIQLSLPVAASTMRRISRAPRDSQWPIESGIAQAHAQGLSGKGVLVGVLDTGCDADHTEFSQKQIDFRYVPLNPAPDGMRTVRGFDVHGHGTHVCGIIAGRNIGIAPDVDLMVASVIDSETVKTSLVRIVIALNWMLGQLQKPEHQDRPMIISMSLGFRSEWISAPVFKSVTDGVQLLLRTLVDDFDVLPVVAIGNDGAGVIRAPGYFSGALAVGAVDFDRNVWKNSGSGVSPDGMQKPDIAGYGVNIVSSLERNIRRRSIYTQMSGTSMATPYVTGIAALYASSPARLQGAALRAHLLNTALPLNAPPERVGRGLARFI
ncbi:MAG TPA: S8 family serine peptidase [Roseiflexaceae bacterium]|nr:S8 family serine peptidase [Roseiflexaceae bacterium]